MDSADYCTECCGDGSSSGGFLSLQRPLTPPRIQDVGKPVAEGPEELVEWPFFAAVVAFEVSMVQVVEVGAGGKSAVQNRPFEAVVSGRMGCEGTTKLISTMLKYSKCSTGCIAMPDQGPGLTFL
jgi:hypothetical protein